VKIGRLTLLVLRYHKSTVKMSVFFDLIYGVKVITTLAECFIYAECACV
jgi:hypothetical protein